MSRRPVNPSRRLHDGGGIPLIGALHHKSRASPLLTVVVVVVVAVFLIVYTFGGTGRFATREALGANGDTYPSREKNYGGKEGGYTSLSGSIRENPREGHEKAGASCTSEVQRAIPILKKAYGDSMRKVLHVGPETCSVVSKLLKEEDTEGWGVEPYDLEDADSSCKSLVRKGFVRVADIKFPLPYRPNSFSLVIVSDAMDYLSPKYLNKTLLDLARVSMDGLVIFAGYPGQQRAKVSELSKFGRPAKLRSSSWWIRYFVQTGLEENEAALKKFEQVASKRSYKPSCQVFHLSSSR